MFAVLSTHTHIWCLTFLSSFTRELCKNFKSSLLSTVNWNCLLRIKIVHDNKFVVCHKSSLSTVKLCCPLRKFAIYDSSVPSVWIGWCKIERYTVYNCCATQSVWTVHFLYARAFRSIVFLGSMIQKTTVKGKEVYNVRKLLMLLFLRNVCAVYHTFAFCMCNQSNFAITNLYYFVWACSMWICTYIFRGGILKWYM